MWVTTLSLVLGSGCLIIGAFIFVRWRKFWKKEVMPPEKSIPDELVTHGMYSYVRHPHYLSNILFCIGVSLVLVSLLDLYFPLILLPCLPSIVGIPFFILGAIEEEKKLTKKFGEAYRAYKKEVPMFIPRLHPHHEGSSE